MVGGGQGVQTGEGGSRVVKFGLMRVLVEAGDCKHRDLQVSLPQVPHASHPVIFQLIQFIHVYHCIMCVYMYIYVCMSTLEVGIDIT